MASLDELFDNIDAAEELLASAKAALDEAVATGNHDRETLWRLYWFSPVSVSAIGKALGIYQVNSVGKHLQPGPALVCLWCAASEPACSRDRLKTGLKSGIVCANCWELRLATNEERWKRKEQAKKARLVALKTMPYDEYLLTPEWQATRRAALKRAGYKCQLCGEGNRRLNVHHNTYENRGEERNCDLCVLCEHCHHDFHDRST